MKTRSVVLTRLGRKLLWRHPGLYRVFGLMRNRGDCFQQDFDLWIDGYPRSANTFAVQAFQLANPEARVRSHRHIPTFIIRATTTDKPGIFLLRKPADAAISWAIFWNEKLGKCLDYYNDFHAALEPHAERLFVAPFESITTEFDRVIEGVNERYATAFAGLVNDRKTVESCFQLIEQRQSEPGGGVNELRVCRPSGRRAPIREELRLELARSPSLREKLSRANDLHAFFQVDSHRSPAPSASRKPLAEKPLRSPV